MLLVHNQGHVLQINKLVIYPSFVNYFCTMRVLHMRYHPGIRGIRVAYSLVLSVSFCLSLFVILSFFSLAIVLSVLRFTAFDYPFGINGYKYLHNYNTIFYNMWRLNTINQVINE